MRIEATDLKRLEMALNKMGEKELRKELRQSTKRLADRGAELAKKEAPVGPTGKLQKTTKGFDSRSGAGVRAGTPSMKYPAIVHWRQRRRKQGGFAARMRGNKRGNRFVIRGIAQMLPEAVKTWQAEVEDIFDRAVNKGR